MAGISSRLASPGCCWTSSCCPSARRPTMPTWSATRSESPRKWPAPWSKSSRATPRRWPPGQALLKLDDTDAKQQLARAAAQLAQTVRQVRVQQAQAVQFDAAITERELQLARAEADLAKREPLLAEQAIAGEEVRHASEAVQMAQAGLTQGATAGRRRARAGGWRHGWQRTRPYWPPAPPTRMPGLPCIARRWWRPPAATSHSAACSSAQRVRARRTHLLTIIPLADVWLEANFKEAQLRTLRIGQPVRIVSDLYGSDVVFHGHVIGLSAARVRPSRCCPPQNASGNWIKVVQRLPVKIALDPPNWRSIRCALACPPPRPLTRMTAAASCSRPIRSPTCMSRPVPTPATSPKPMPRRRRSSAPTRDRNWRRQPHGGAASASESSTGRIPAFARRPRWCS